MQYGGDLLSGLGLPALFTVCSGEVWPGLWVLCGGKGMIISVSLSFGTRTCEFKLVISIASPTGGRPCSMPGSEGAAGSGGHIVWSCTFPFIQPQGYPGAGSWGWDLVWFSGLGIKKRMPRERDDFGSIRFLIGTT